MTEITVEYEGTEDEHIYCVDARMSAVPDYQNEIEFYGESGDAWTAEEVLKEAHAMIALVEAAQKRWGDG